MTTATTNADHSRVPGAGRHRSSRPRTLNLVDLENLVGGDVVTPRVQSTWSEFVQVTDSRHHDLSTVAVARRHATTAFFALPSTILRLVGEDRPDGADIALIESIDADWTAANFGQVVIGSGDHIFAPTARQLRDRGLRVVQVIGAGRCSTDLYLACSEHRYLSSSRPARHYRALRPTG